MLKNIINTLPYEIINIWIDGKNAHVCELWHMIWCTKPMSVKLWYEPHICNHIMTDYSLDTFFKFKCLIELNLGSTLVTEESFQSLTMLRILVINDNKYVTDRMLYNLTNLTSLS